MKILSILSAMLYLALAQNAFAKRVSDASEAAALCSAPFTCDAETIASDNRAPLRIDQPANPTPVQGLCGTLPRGLDYRARPTYFTCSGGGTESHTRGPIEHDADQIDKNFSLLSIGNREGAQKALLKKDYGWKKQIKVNVSQNWTYMQKVGAYTDCSDQPGAQGGESESYQTICYRSNRKEKVVQRVVRKETFCSKKNPPPPPPPVSSGGGSSGSTYGEGSGGFSGGSGGSYSPSRSSSGGGGSYSPSRPSSGDGYSAPKGRGESSGENRSRMDRGRNSSSEYKLEQMKIRAPALTYRRIADDIRTDKESEPMYGCARWETRTVSDEDTYSYEDVEDISYTCTKTRNKWCTWYQQESSSQLCPEQKTINIQVKYQTPADWNPKNPAYDDQLPNKFDLLLGESEIITVGFSSGSRDITPNAEIKNGMQTRKDPWNKYSTNWSPRTLDCRYQDQEFDLEITPERRIVQSAPNPLDLPDGYGEKAVSEELDSSGRPKNLNLKNKARGLVLDRSGLSRIYGKDQSEQSEKSRVGITRKAWENTRFWMRLWWLDGNNKVKVTLGRHFNINQASPEGDRVSISLAGENGMSRFYKMAVPFEEVFGFLGGDVSLDPSRKYEIEIKTAQPGFDGIYIGGLDDDSSLSDEEKKLVNKDAYSESLWIPFDASNSKRSLLQRFWDWRAGRMKRF
ncbi:MAG: hypothetical protein A4S09_00195 [Proteobacteria bacterium SG_bin7]|nr:MAG: hypothetical protein A4S09_00195 [Proteobacteria bacterium SG_bin7]